MKTEHISKDNSNLKTAKKLFLKKNYSEAYPIYMQFASIGDTDCQVFVCHMLLEGLGVKQNIEDAEQWCKKASESGDPEAIFFLGKVYAKKKQYEEMRKYFQISAEKEYSPALYRLGKMYDDGLIRPIDDKKAMEYYEQASELGHLVARKLVIKELLLGKRGISGWFRGLYLLLTYVFVAFEAFKEDPDTEKVRV